MKFLYTALLVIFFISSVFAQKQGNQWYFGVYAGLDFNTVPPSPILTSDLDSYEACASIADKTTGKLLFYSDGVYVWDSTNTVMPNGGNLGGTITTTQGAIIVPIPGSDSLYYLFTLGAQGGFTGDSGFYFNVINMSLHGGLGAVTINDSLLLAPVTEKCAVTLAADGINYWVVVHQWRSNAFYSYLVTDIGISAPVISHSGIVIENVGSQGNSEANGYMRISNNGNKIALDCLSALNLMQLSDFNNATGVVSNSVTDTGFPGSSGPYGLCFSPHNSKLYITYNADTSIVYQYNMLECTNSAIIASRKNVGIEVYYGGGAIQQGPDGKLYVVRGGSDSLSVIVNPDSLGAKCNFIVDGIGLGGKDCFLGLPDIIPFYNTLTVSNGFVVAHPPSAVICSGQSVALTATGSTTYSWSPATGLNSTTGDSVLATPAADITYTVTNTASNGCLSSDSTVITVLLSPNMPSFTQHNDMLISSAVHDNLWYRNDTLLSGDTSQYLIITSPGEYRVYVLNEANGCGTSSDSIDITSLTEIDQLSAISNQLSVYPNPFNNEIFIKINSSADNVKDWAMQLTDLLGRTLYSMSPLNPLKGTFDIDLSNLPNGVYFITVINKTGRDVVPVVKQN